MMEEKKKRPKIGLSLFSNLTSNKKKSPTTRTFENCEAVGLGILLVSPSLTHHHHHHHRNNTTTNSNNNNKTSPIPIVSLSKAVANFNNKRDASSDYDEGYTCVISHVEGRIKRHVYFYGDEVKPNGILHASTSPVVLVSSRGGTSKMEFGFSEERRELWGKDFLSACYLCRKLLHGLDIFMYRGEKAFCSVECREKQIISEDYRDKCSSEASPCSSLQVFFSGVAAA